MDDIAESVAKETVWWIKKRTKKLEDELMDSMTINPFLVPVLYEMHAANNLEDLGALLVVGHLMGGHNTGFGKLVDEKILPKVFGTQKLSSEFRKANPLYQSAHFSDIDHLIERPERKPDLLSLKASKWTIQLGQAKGLNDSFKKILEQHGEQFGDLVVGVYYGKATDLTDKYRLVRGERSERNIHAVTDLTERVFVHSGKEFWAWLNNGQQNTQNMVLRGILAGIREFIPSEQTTYSQKFAGLLDGYNEKFASRLKRFMSQDGTVDWDSFLEDINS